MSRYHCAFDEQVCRFQTDDDIEVAKHVAGTGHGRCAVCAASLQRHELRVCVACVGQARANLRDIIDGAALLPAGLERLGSNTPRRDATRNGDGSDRLPGGDGLVMLAGGSWGLSETPDTYSDEDPPPVAFELRRWETEWRAARGEPAVDSPPVVTTVVAYLWPRTGWAAANQPNFPTYAQHLTHIASWLTRVNRSGEQVDTTDARCLYCESVRLRKVWGETEADDRWVCPRCQRSGTKAHYWVAVVATLRAQQGDAS